MIFSALWGDVKRQKLLDFQKTGMVWIRLTLQIATIKSQVKQQAGGNIPNAQRRPPLVWEKKMEKDKQTSGQRQATTVTSYISIIFIINKQLFPSWSKPRTFNILSQFSNSQAEVTNSS